MKDPEQPPPPRPPAKLTCDRFCRACSFNLVGCAVEREEKYGLFVVRCPGCGAFNAVDHYPRAGAWAERWMLLLAALWLFLLPVIAVGTDLAIIGGTYGIAMEAGWPVRSAIDTEFMEWAAERHGGDSNAVYGNYWEEYSAFFQEFGAAGVVGRIGGLWKHVSLGALMIGIIPLLGSALMGCFWAVALLGATRRARLLASAIPFVSIAAVALLVTWVVDTRSSRLDVYAFVATNITNFLWCGLMLCMLGGLLAGVLWGRMVTRVVIAALLPPRLVSSFRILWDVDGVAPPRPRSATRQKRITRQ